MKLDISGALLEGARVASSANPFVYPPKSFVGDESIFSGTTGRAEYCLIVSGQSEGSSGMDLGDPNLRILWTRNDSVFRFDNDSFNRRWFPAPGSVPLLVGSLTNSPPQTAPVPKGDGTGYHLYIGLPRIATLSVDVVADATRFGSPSAGTVEVSAADGQVNLSAADIANPSYFSQSLYCSRQDFFDRTKSDGSLGVVPSSGQPEMFLNPVPTSGQIPIVRIGFRRPLTAVAFSTETAMPVPSSGTVNFALDTGRVLFSLTDLAAALGEKVYYVGVFLGSLALSRTIVGDVPAPSLGQYRLVGSFPTSVGETDSTRYVAFVGSRYYLTTVLQSTTTSVASGTIVVDPADGSLYMSSQDCSALSGQSLTIVDTFVGVDGGTSVQLRRSAINGPGIPVVNDFVENWSVSGQVIADGIQGSPFVMMTNTPVQDSSLTFSVTQGSGGGGTFVGPLADATDPLTPGLGRLLQLDQKRVTFTNRKTSTKSLLKSSPSIKLDDASVVESGFVAKRNGVVMTSGTDFSFDPVGGLVDFLEPIGEGDPRSLHNVPCSVVSSNSFSATFSSSPVGMWLLVPGGPNAGIRRILSGSAGRYIVDRQFPSTSLFSADVLENREIVANRFWKTLSPSLKKFKLEIGTSSSGPFFAVPETDFSVVPQTGQVNLLSPSSPGSVYRATYVWLDSPDDGVTVTPTTKTAFAPFKVRMDSGTYVPGTRVVGFNQAGRTVLPDRGIVMTIDGVRADPATYVFSAPGSLSLGRVLTSEQVILDYFVSESPGGNRVFDLESPLDVDYPTFPAGATSVTMNGDVTQYVRAGSSLLMDGKDVLCVLSSSHDTTADTTAIVFSTPVTSDWTGPFKSCASLSFVPETLPVSTLPSGGNSLRISGTSDIRSGTIIKIDDDPYLVISSSVTASGTEIVLASPAPQGRNYVVPSVVKSSVPVLDPGTDFSTSRSANTSLPFLLFLEGTSPRLLTNVVDYRMSDGGTVKLDSPIGYGDELIAAYVARVDQPAGTNFEFNYAYLIAPNDSNGLPGQKLLASYSLYSPDSFFYRVETVESYVPELSAAIKQSSSSGPSGPSVSSVSSLKNKDFGYPSLEFDSQKYANQDLVIRRLLKFYNDLASAYEDVVSDMDGTVVGGTSGKFRFDGIIDNPPRSSYAEVTNDIDDRVFLYNDVGITGFFVFVRTPVYGKMSDPIALSRLYPTRTTMFAAIDASQATPEHYGEAMGVFRNAKNLIASSTFYLAPSVSRFSGVIPGVGTTQFSIDANGDADTLTPGTVAGQRLIVCRNDGTQIGPTNVVSVSGAGPFSVVVDAVFNMLNGGFFQDTIDQSVSLNSGHTYSSGIDIAVNPENGQILNIQSGSGSFQKPIVDNQITSTDMTFNNFDTSPRRQPAFDGSMLTDSGYPSFPPLRYLCETETLGFEKDFLASAPHTLYGSASVDADLVTVSGCTMSVVAGDIVSFVGGPNSGQNRTVFSSIGGGVFVVSTPFPSLDVSPQFVTKVVRGFDYGKNLAATSSILLGSTRTVPPTGAIIGTLDSEMASMVSIGGSLGDTVSSGSGSVAGTVLTDAGAAFGSPDNWVVVVPSGPNVGVYWVDSATDTTLTVSSTAPFSGFPSTGSVSYELLSLYAFLTKAGPSLLAGSLASSRDFLAATSSWTTAPTELLAAARLAAVVARISAIAVQAESVRQLLSNGDKIYDTRFSWIRQRVDKKIGTLFLKTQAEAKMLSDLASMVDNQRKLLVTESL